MPKSKQDHQDAAGTTFATQTLKGEGDDFHPDCQKTQAIAQCEQFRNNVVGRRHKKNKTYEGGRMSPANMTIKQIVRSQYNARE
jgi:hypothetical protein